MSSHQGELLGPRHRHSTGGAAEIRRPRSRVQGTRRVRRPTLGPAALHAAHAVATPAQHPPPLAPHPAGSHTEGASVCLNRAVANGECAGNVSFQASRESWGHKEQALGQTRRDISCTMEPPIGHPPCPALHPRPGSAPHHERFHASLWSDTQPHVSPPYGLLSPCPSPRTSQNPGTASPGQILPRPLTPPEDQPAQKVKGKRRSFFKNKTDYTCLL